MKMKNMLKKFFEIIDRAKNVWINAALTIFMLIVIIAIILICFNYPEISATVIIAVLIFVLIKGIVEFIKECKKEKL